VVTFNSKLGWAQAKEESMTPRIFVAIVGVWLMASVFLWPHSGTETLNVALVGAFAVVFALLSLIRDWARYLNMAAAVWLILSTLRYGSLSRVTLWNNVVMAAAIFAASLLGAGPDDLRRERQLYGRI
jgi:hypothetical protein